MSEHFYWYEGKKIPLTPSSTKQAVRFEGEHPGYGGARNMQAGEMAQDGIELMDGIFLYDAPKGEGEPMGAMRADHGGKALRVFETENRANMILTEQFIAKFKPEVTRKQIEDFNRQNNVSIISEDQWDRNSFVLTVKDENSADTLETANRYQESGMVVYSHPNFVRLLNRSFAPNDTLYSKQWALHNTGQGGGVAGQDMHVENAWNITKGSQNITIAIIDEGVDYSHEDFNAAGKLVTGYDAVKKTNDPTPNKGDAHGTACAGIAAASGNNGTGVCGVAPDCRIMGVRIAYGTQAGWVTSDSIIADGINTAVARGADVLSNSWGGGTPSNLITDAIRRAKTLGRGGKGCVVCFAAGNDNGPVSYPGTLPEVITVAACNEFGERKSPTSRDGENWWGSNYGPEVDVSAPGVHIVTTDIMNEGGYNPNGNYVHNFNGTSSATPHVAGVAALVLSANPNLSANEVDAILRNSTDDLDQSGYDNYTGFGRINAFKAVEMAHMRWDNPRLIPGWFGAENQGGDIAIGDISGNGRSDLLVFHIDNPGGENHGYYRIGWELNNNGDPTSWSPIKPIPGWFGAENQGAGVSLADINGNGKLDLIVYHIDNPQGENHGYYRIGWDLNNNGDPSSWSQVKPIPGWFGAEDQGAGIAVADLNGDGKQELIIFHIDNPNGENKGYYRIGWALNNNGDVTGGWSDIKAVPGWFGAQTNGGGITVADIDKDGKPELVVFNIDNPRGENHGYYRIGDNITSSGDIANWSQPKPIPGWFGARNQGGGIAMADINADNNLELLTYHIDNPGGENHGYYRIGWNIQQ